MTHTAILSVNSGSSTIKFALYQYRQSALAEVMLSGLIEGLEPGGQPQIRISYDGEQHRLVLDAQPGGDVFDMALAHLRTQLREHSSDAQIVAVAHRIVHGGERYSASVMIDDSVFPYLRSLHHLAPLHQPHNLDGVVAFQKAFPGILQVACFDTGFHAQMPLNEYTFALPQDLRDAGIRRYGFHGLSYRFVSAQLARLSTRAGQRVIMAHLGNGASACAMKNSLSIATTMGFSALDGLMMGTRCGALDPGVLMHLLQDGWNAQRIENMLYKQSGLLGVSGISADMRTLRVAAQNQPQAQAAIDLFAYRLIRECGGLAAVLNGVDVLAFTGGIGEHDAQLRADAVAGLSYLGLLIDPEKNHVATGDTPMAIHSADSAAEIWVIPTDEGRIAAQDAANLLAGTS
jgi:acetate kinase